MSKSCPKGGRPKTTVFPVDPFVAAARERLMAAFASPSWDVAEFGAARLQLDTLLNVKHPRKLRPALQLEKLDAGS